MGEQGCSLRTKDGPSTTKVCSKCGETKPLAEFYARSSGSAQSACKPCYRRSVKAYADANRDKVRDGNRRASRRFRDKNREYERARVRAYWAANSDKHNANNKAWREANPDKHAAKEARRRAVKRNATPSWANQRYIGLFYKLAKLESERTGLTVHVDHIVPLKSDVVCGLHCEDNLQLLTETDNLQKGNRMWPGMWD